MSRRVRRQRNKEENKPDEGANTECQNDKTSEGNKTNANENTDNTKETTNTSRRRTRTRTTPKETSSQINEITEKEEPKKVVLEIKLPDAPEPQAKASGRPTRRTRTESKPVEEKQEEKIITAYELRRRGRDRQRKQQENTVSEFVDSEEGPPLLNAPATSTFSQLREEFAGDYSDDYIDLQNVNPNAAEYDENYVFQVPKGKSATVSLQSSK
ncbi:hypothetical protein TVAG_036140 [Trichomonas vaginalis G3]|uniref:Uncharacterized protein n=1 Tax=Trichomonas vaginalis (strain ATCC PRA-98 / G3) TaxID=412133 RepID=A2DAT6_TRIV3|nr:hypothetical protein TVAGG3_0812640 [Trichomonas vaginalis G3]EAY22589.1 hypothetical protein TVAG_036140 [Trichomonas vaginalis G3]KAI5497321.1 hypothetical protein TVAGG3_0812640 [Trichomonas vaginalis G3]|eukprot:XP_001583575.1 hypothetical protein [Trichomonas vaginalis G3]